MLRVLCLHGYQGNGAGLRRQMEPLVRGLSSPVEFVYVDAPSLSVGDYGWWHLNFRGWPATRAWAIDLFAREPHFDGVFGFSQGAALTALLTGMRAPDGRRTDETPLSFEFAMMVSGFRSDSAMHADLFAAPERFAIPSVHIMSPVDRVVGYRDSQELAAQFAAPLVLEHHGGHVVPDNPLIRAAVARFLAERGA